MTIPSEGTNISTHFQYYVDQYIEAVTSTAPDKKGSSNRSYKAKEATTISTQKGTSKLGAHLVPYRPELMAILAEGL
jgi:hypothetical protein